MIGSANPNYPGKRTLPEGMHANDIQAAHDELDWLTRAMTQIGATVKLYYGHMKRDDLEVIAERLVEGAYNSNNIFTLRDDDIAEQAGLLRWQKIAEDAFIEAFNSTEATND